jgi:nitrogen fixation-related uncharacterized protein
MVERRRCAREGDVFTLVGSPSGPERLPRIRDGPDVSAIGCSGPGNNMLMAVFIIATVSAVLTAAVVLGLFVWAARKDGQYDRQVQARLGIRRRTRL